MPGQSGPKLTDHRCLELGGCHDLNLVSPREQMPRHLEEASCTKENEHRPVGLGFNPLAGMKPPAERVFGGSRQNLEHDLLGRPLEHAERLGRIVLKIEVGGRRGNGTQH